MAKLAYYASLLPGKESQYETPEGYRVYKNVPIARTGEQDYLGKELKRFPGYDAEWALNDDQVYTVHRTPEEVTDRATLASFEGKSVLDEHPAGEKSLIDAYDEEEGYTKGHAQNVRVGEKLQSGETPLIADLLVKHPTLNQKIEDGVRDVSCGYTLALAKDSTGRIVMKDIRGNHVAVVPKGRAGSEVGIKDAASPECTKGEQNTMAHLKEAFGKVFKAWVKDANPDEIADMVGAKDAEPEKEKQVEKEEKKEPAKDAARDKAEKAFNDCWKAKASKDANLPDLINQLTEFFTEEESEPAHANDETPEEKEEREKAPKDAEEKKEKEDKAEDDAEVVPMEKTELAGAGDAEILLKALAPVIAKSKDKGATDAYNRLRRSVKAHKAGATDGAENPFDFLVTPGAALDSQREQIDVLSCFNGKPYKDGLAALEALQSRKGGK
jgi:hypothetical protein